MNRTITQRVAAGVAVLILLALAGAVGYFIAHRAAPAASSSASAQPAGKKVLYWYDPMTPQQHFDHPGISPKGMQMVPKYATGNANLDQNIVRINPAEVQNLG
ncbi:MAG: efflux RND transporter periplasmic adaptor subunit, partial [Sinobacteraceae bacterium]|nr:efflux RND transporter periplasmic adaptor subunit [Nevskiaceae bacterium]